MYPYINNFTRNRSSHQGVFFPLYFARLLLIGPNSSTTNFPFTNCPPSMVDMQLIFYFDLLATSIDMSLLCNIRGGDFSYSV